jgi:hypothetical protein
MDVMPTRASNPSAERPCSPKAGYDSIPDQITLKLSNGREDVKQQPT